jgi:hypothetical protein
MSVLVLPECKVTRVVSRQRDIQARKSDYVQPDTTRASPSCLETISER